MRRRKTITKTDLFWEAIRKPLLDTLGAAFAGFALTFVFGIVARIFDKSLPTVLQLLYISIFAFVFMFVACALTEVLVAAFSLRLLKKQEKACRFSFADEKMTWEAIPSDWYINCEFCRVIAVRRGYILKAGKPEYEYKLLWKMKVKDITGEKYYLKGTAQQIEGLKKWLNTDTDQETWSVSN